ncbi:SGNH/GDSL hydrolase family protein [Nocardia sp. NPDC052566]|uniref:SGNH/GDSL hydrolase family protein n=1 Tax=Nocardia sp. NPDC052566 TaxID=3364330 RepID=UPI0037C6452F
MNTTARVLIAGAALGVALPVGGVQASAAPAVTEYVALGDSWAADATLSQGTAEFVPGMCAQSRNNYAKQVAATLRVPVFRDATCGGAVTKNMTEPQQFPVGPANAPQFDSLSATTDLVTLEIGGNDAGLAATVQACLTSDPALSVCKAANAVDGGDRMSVKIAESEAKVRATIDGIRERAPHARILLLDYLEGIGTVGGCFPTIPISDADAVWLGSKLLELNQMLARVARASNVEFVDTYSTSGGHDACQPAGVRWVEGLIPFSSNPVGLAVPFHPNQLGADHQARSVLGVLGR